MPRLAHLMRLDTQPGDGLNRDLTPGALVDTLENIDPAGAYLLCIGAQRLHLGAPLGCPPAMMARQVALVKNALPSILVSYCGERYTATLTGRMAERANIEIILSTNPATGVPQRASFLSDWEAVTVAYLTGMPLTLTDAERVRYLPYEAAIQR